MCDQFQYGLGGFDGKLIYGAQEYIAVIPDTSGLRVDVAGSVSAARCIDEEMVPCQNFVAVFIPLIATGGADGRLMS